MQMPGPLFIGHHPDAGALRAAMDLADVVVHARALPCEEVAAVDAFLAARAPAATCAVGADTLVDRQVGLGERRGEGRGGEARQGEGEERRGSDLIVFACCRPCMHSPYATRSSM